MNYAGITGRSRVAKTEAEKQADEYARTAAPGVLGKTFAGHPARDGAATRNAGTKRLVTATDQSDSCS